MDIVIWQWLGFSGILILVGFLLFLFFVPKKHNGYYMCMAECGGVTLYQIYNDWSYWPDDVAYRSTEKDDALKVFKELKGNSD